MGKNLIQQARGKGSMRYRSPSFRYRGSSSMKSMSKDTVSGVIFDFVDCPGHSAPLAMIEFDDGELSMMIAPDGMRVGDEVSVGTDAPVSKGNSIALGNLPDGTMIHNIESRPGDGGKFVRSSGVFAKVMTKTQSGVVVVLPSKKQKVFDVKCRATIGLVAGGGRKDKPFGKAGTKFYAMRAKNKLWPIVSGGSMNAVDHPMGNKRSSRKSKGKPAPHNAPPGRKVGMIRPRHTGRNK